MNSADQMFGIDRRAASWTFTAVVVLLGFWLVYLVRSTLFVFILAVLFAYLLAPLVNTIDRFLPARKTRTLALALAYVIFVGLAVTAAIAIGSRVVEQATLLAQTFPATLKSLQLSFQNHVPDSLQTELATRTNAFIASLPGYGIKFLGLMGNLIYVVLIPILSFFCLKDGAAAKRHFVGLVDPGPHRKLLEDVLADMNLVLAHYMRALVLLAICTFTCYSIFLTILSVPYALLLGALSALLEFIPVIGPLSAAVIVVLLGGATVGHIPALLIFLGVFRMFQDYMVSPHIMGTRVELHPLLVLFGVFAGAELAGVAGTLLSVPILALVRVLYQRIYQARQAAREAKLAA